MLERLHSDSLRILSGEKEKKKRATITTIVSANDFNFHLIIPLNAALKRMGIDRNFHDCTIFPVGTMARSERGG